MSSKKIKKKHNYTKDIDEIDKKVTETRESIENVVGGLRAMEPETIGLKNEKIQKFNSNSMKFSGRDGKSKKLITEESSKKLSTAYKRVNRIFGNGIDELILQSRANKYIEDNCPNIKKSNKLFSKDVCSGAFWSSYEPTLRSIEVLKDFKSIGEDDKVTETIEKIINPVKTTKESTSDKAFKDIDLNATILSRRDGYAFVRLIPHKKVLTELYIKYVLKREKLKTVPVKKKRKIIKPKTHDAVSNINDYFKDINFQSVVTESEDLSFLPKEILSSIPKMLLSEETVTSGTECLSSELSSYENNEVVKYGDETFRDFAQRCLSGNNINATEFKNNNEETRMLSWNLNSYTSDVGMEAFDSLFNDYTLRCGYGETKIGLESETAFNDFNVFDKETISRVNFSDIYAVNVNSVLSKLQSISGENIRTGLESEIGVQGTTLVSTLSPIENLVKKLLIDTNVQSGLETESINMLKNSIDTSLIDETSMLGLETELVLKPSNPQTQGTEASVTFNSKTSYKTLDNQYRDTTSISTISKNTLEQSKRKSIKTFDKIKGVSIEILDNTRIIPVMMGGKQNGVFFIERTHTETEHLRGSRMLIATPVMGSTMASGYMMDEEKREQGVGNLLFSDIIKPILERNMSTKFLKDNADLMYTVKKLIDENEESRIGNNPGTDIGLYDLSKITYIPPEDIVLYTNGPGLGTSKFKEAFVPANAKVLANESYLSWILVDSRGMVFLEYPQGVSDMPEEYGGDRLGDQLREYMVTRLSLKEGSARNMQLSTPIIPIPVSEGNSGRINMMRVDPGDFNIDRDIIKDWENEATTIIGYPSSLFSSLDGNGVDLARKIESVNASIVLAIEEAQDAKAPSSNELATKILHYRGGKEYENYFVRWIPPRPSKSANETRSEETKDKKETLDSYMEIFRDAINDDEFEELKPYLIKILLSKMYDTDKILNSIETIIGEARTSLNVKTSEDTEEK